MLPRAYSNRMTNQVRKILRDQYSKIVSLRQDSDEESELVEKIQSALKQYEAKQAVIDANSLATNPSNNTDLFEVIDADQNYALNNLSTSSKTNPRVNLARLITNYCFVQLNSHQQIPKLLKELILKLKSPLLRLTIDDPSSIISLDNPIFVITELLVGYTPLWKDESSVNYPTFGKLATILNFSQSPHEQLSKKLQDAMLPVAQIRENQQKRSLIFEKRLVERETSSALTSNAQFVVSNLLQVILNNYQLEPLLSDFLKQEWSRLMQLQYVRKDHEGLIQAIVTYVLLVLSVRKVSTKQEFDWLLESLPILSKLLTQGFEKLSLAGDVTSNFLAQVESIHLKIIKENAHNEFENQSSNSLESQSNNEEIIRLKPSGVFAPYSEQPEQLDTAEETKTDRTSDCAEPLPKSLNFIELIENMLLEEKCHLEKDYSVSFKKAFSCFEQEFLLVNTEIQSKLHQLDDINVLTINDWYSIGNSKQLNKLIYINQYTGEHIFVNQAAQISHQLSPDELFEMHKSDELTPFTLPNFIEPALKKAIGEINDEIRNSIKEKPVSQSKKIDTRVLEFPLSNKDLKSGNEENELITQDDPSAPLSVETTNKQSNITKQSLATDLSSLTVGSWILLNETDPAQKCKLAARITSKDSYIFVDRKGVKVLELNGTELLECIQTLEITLLSTENNNSQLLESVIAKTRFLKAES